MIADINVVTQKQDIIQWLTTINDEKIVGQFFALKNKFLSEESVYRLNEFERESIRQGLEDVKAGRVVPHEEVRKIYAKWL